MTDKKSKTPLIDLAPKLMATVKRCQHELAQWILPDSKITDKEILNKLLGILDDKTLIEKMREIECFPNTEKECSHPRYERVIDQDGYEYCRLCMTFFEI